MKEQDRWSRVQPKRKNSAVLRSPRSSKPRGKQYKLVIKAADDGSWKKIDEVITEIMRDRGNKLLLSQIGTACNYTFEYANRDLLSHNYRGGVTFCVLNPQEAARFMNLGVLIRGRKHRVMNLLERELTTCVHIVLRGVTWKEVVYSEAPGDV